MLNRVQLVGRLGHAPEFRVMQNGKDMAILSLAARSSWIPLSGNPLRETPLRETPLRGTSLSESSLRETSSKVIPLKGNAPMPNDSGVSTSTEWHHKTEWHRVAIFRQAIVEWTRDHLRKGDLLLVEGKLSYSEWEGKQGLKQRVATIVISEGQGTLQFIRSQKSHVTGSDEEKSEDDENDGEEENE